MPILGDAISGLNALKANPAFWFFRKNEVFDSELAPNVNAYSAVANIFSNDSNPNYSLSKYAFACHGGALVVCTWGVAQTLGSQQFANSVGVIPLEFTRTNFLVDRDEHDANFWIPGDWGFLVNQNYKRDGARAGTEGENVIYLGTPSGDFNESVFATQGTFWGLGFGTNTLQNLIQSLDTDWLGEANAISVSKMRITPEP